MIYLTWLLTFYKYLLINLPFMVFIKYEMISIIYSKEQYVFFTSSPERLFTRFFTSFVFNIKSKLWRIYSKCKQTQLPMYEYRIGLTIFIVWKSGEFAMMGKTDLNSYCKFFKSISMKTFTSSDYFSLVLKQQSLLMQERR